jgi:hypothetical protein
MATKAERFRYEMERSGTTRRKRKKAGSPPPTQAGAHEEKPSSKSAARKPARQKGKRQKAGAPLKNKQLLLLTSPQSRHEQGARPVGSSPIR